MYYPAPTAKHVSQSVSSSSMAGWAVISAVGPWLWMILAQCSEGCRAPPPHTPLEELQLCLFQQKASGAQDKEEPRPHLAHHKSIAACRLNCFYDPQQSQKCSKNSEFLRKLFEKAIICKSERAVSFIEQELPEHQPHLMHRSCHQRRNLSTAVFV